MTTSQLGGSGMTENDILKLKRMYRCEGTGGNWKARIWNNFKKIRYTYADLIHFLGGSVSCGRHTAPTCQGCPGNNGRSWCNGDCRWDAVQKECIPKGENI